MCVTYAQTGLTDDLAGLSRDGCKGVYYWLNFFKRKHPKYVFRGRLVGRLFDKSGRATQAFEDFLDCAGARADAQETPEAQAERCVCLCVCVWVGVGMWVFACVRVSLSFWWGGRCLDVW
jgi:hypothetical protein